MKNFFLLTLALLLASQTARALDEARASDEQLAFFEKKIRPVLADKCYQCHSEKAEKIKGGLVLDTREGIRRGGDNGPAVVPGDLNESLLIESIRYGNKETAMPPEKKGGKLPDEIIKDIETWVKMGAADPREGMAKVVKKFDMDEASKWWAFQPVQKPSIAKLHETDWARIGIDRFVQAKLEEKGLKPVADADPATLLRRLYFDLIGLPPSVQELNGFLKKYAGRDPQAAVENAVDRLLASPRFGERWGRHWLDVARFAESSGKDVNFAFPSAWRYRDYVIAAFNDGKPYDQFIREQVAGDLLPARNAKERAEQMVATGFLAIGAKGLNEQNARQFALDLADEQIDSLSQSILGLTIACARCHDHKFDPISQRDYYAMAGIFLSTSTHYGTPQSIQNRHSTELLELPAETEQPVLARTMGAGERKLKEARLEDLRKEQREIITARFAQRNGTATAAPAGSGANAQRRGLVVLTQAGMLDMELKSFDENGNPRALAMGVRDFPANPALPFRGGPGGFLGERIRERAGGRPPQFSKIGDSAFYSRGDVDKPGEKVLRGFPSLLSASNAPSIPPDHSGRRELGECLASPTNPLTARVMSNRVWHWLFGEGIVRSTDNFGTSGEKPSDQALLDYLAARLVENGWSIKKLIREIVLSRTYQLASAYDEKNFTADPENTFHWRMSKRRLDAECIRDAMLSASGRLDLRAPIGSIIAQAGEGPIAGRGFRGVGEDAIINASSPQRSVYLPVARDVLPDALAVFDFAEPTLVTGVRETTNVPAQALYMLNSSFVSAQAHALAERVLAACPAGPNGGAAANFDQRLPYAYWLIFSRQPDPAEWQAASNFLTRFPSNWNKADKSPAGLRDAAGVTAIWSSLCRALFASAEFRYLN